MVEELSQRRWAAGYLALVGSERRSLAGHTYLAGNPNGRLVNWVSAQSGPTALDPYSSGSARSDLMAMVTGSHHGLRLEPAEVEKLACWIDLQVPFCGDYRESNHWAPDERARYDRFLEKRRIMEDVERAGREFTAPPRHNGASSSGRSGG